MTSPKVLAITPIAPPVYRIHGNKSPEQIFAIASRKILGAKTEQKKWLALFGCNTWLLEGLPESQRLSLVRAAAWRVADAAIRRHLRNGRPEAFSQMAPDLAHIVRNFQPVLTVMDFERIALDAIQSLPPKAFKRRKVAHASDDN
ncbi:MAG: hypothetical protein ACJ8IK_00315 [Burkholderiaceae bacterium]